jgi:parvulin-like peptidyl-prolyl isomerase
MSPEQHQPEYLRQLFLDQAIAGIECTEADRAQFWAQQQDETAYQSWLQQQGITSKQFEIWLERELKIRKFQYLRWGRKLYSYFLERKSDLDQVICSLIYLHDTDLAQELYFRLVEGEESFATLAQQYSQGQEAKTGGRVGPIALGTLPPQLARMFYGGQLGQLWFPVSLGKWVVIARLEASLPARLDAAMGQYLLNELLEAWLQEQISQQFPAS